jgi:hypothetical protein
MKIRAFWGAALVVACGGGLGWSEEGSMPKAEVHFTFAVPDYDSTISLGLFDEQGGLVRRLAEIKPERDFFIGLNGLVAYWDGKNDAGVEVEPGTYEVRGFAVGAFAEEADAVLGNDWWQAVGEELAPVEIADIGFGPDGVLILVGRNAGGRAVVLGLDPGASSLRWQLLLPEEKEGRWLLAQPTTEWVFLLQEGDFFLLDAASGQVIARGTVPLTQGAVLSAEIADGVLHLVSVQGTRSFDLLGMQEMEKQEETPRPPSRLRWRSPRLPDFAVDADGRGWVRGETGWTIFLPEDDARFAVVVPGREGRFWGLVRQGISGVYRVGQFDLEGEFLRQVDPETFGGQPRGLAVGEDEQTVYVLSTLPGPGSELLGFRQEENEEDQGWKIFFRRAIAPEQVAEAEEYRPLPLRMKLALASALGRGREATTFRLLLAKPGTVELRTPEGLLVARLLQRPQIFSSAVAVDPERPNALFFQVQQTGLTERVAVIGLERIARLSIGPITWPSEGPGTQEAPDQP